MEIFIATVQLITLLIIIWYTVETHKLRKGQNEIIQQNVESTEPNIIVSFEDGDKFSQIYIEIENVGKQTAYDIKFLITPPFDVKHHIYNKYVNENGALSKGLPLLKGGKKIRILSGSTTDLSKYYNNSEININYIFTINYRNYNNIPYRRICKDSIDKFFTRLHPEGKSSETKALEEINKTLREIVNRVPDQVENNE